MLYFIRTSRGGELMAGSLHLKKLRRFDPWLALNEERSMAGTK